MEKKRSKPHDPAAARPEIQLGGHVDEQGKPWVVLVVNGMPIPIGIPTAIEIGKAMLNHAAETASDALLYEFLLSMKLSEQEGMPLEEAQSIAFASLQAFVDYKVQRADMAEQMNRAIAYGTHTPATPESEGEEVQA